MYSFVEHILSISMLNGGNDRIARKVGGEINLAVWLLGTAQPNI